MNNFGELLKSHLSNWSLVWFGFLFWGSIFSAFLLLFFNNIDQVLEFFEDKEVIGEITLVIKGFKKTKSTNCI